MMHDNIIGVFFVANLKKKITKSELLLCLSVIIFPLAFIIPYICIFMSASNYTLSDNHSAWASFGSYIGGTIGPLISGFAFIGIWKTYNLQREQLQLADNQRKSEVSQHMILDAAKHIDELLNVNIDISTIVHNTEPDPRMKMEETIFFLSQMYIDEKLLDLESRDKIKKAISVEMKKIMNLLDIMAILILKYERISNDITLRQYYTLRYVTTLACISMIGLEINKKTSDVFNIKVQDLIEK